MGLISFLFFQCKTAFNVSTCSQTSHSCFPLFDVDHLEIAHCSNLTTVFYPLVNFGHVLCIKSCYEDLNLTRKSHNCTGIAFIQGDSAGSSKLIEQTLSTFKIQFCELFLPCMATNKSSALGKGYCSQSRFGLTVFL